MGQFAVKADRVRAQYPGLTRDKVLAIADLNGDERLSAAAKKRAAAPYLTTINTLWDDARAQLAKARQAALDNLERERSKGLAQLLADPLRYDSIGKMAAQLDRLALGRYCRAAEEAGDAGLAEAIRRGVATRPTRDGDAEALEPLGRIGTVDLTAAIAEVVAVQHVAAQLQIKGPLGDAAPMMADPVKVCGLADLANCVPDGFGGTTILNDAQVASLLEVAGISSKMP